jgi:hypothetical protein
MELTPETKERLQSVATEGDTIRDFCRHPGFALYKKELEVIISDNKNTWLQGNDEDAKTARYEARGVQKALSVLKKFILSGDNAKQVLYENATSDLSTPTESGQGTQE